MSCLIASVPELDTGAARAALATAKAEHGRAMHEIDALLKEHPGALMTTPAAYPLALVRLVHALMDAGYQAVVAPACAGCGRITIDLRRNTASGRICGTCAARDSKGTCTRCGQAKRIYARRPEGGICSACYDKDEQVVTECSGCGRMRRAAARMPDGSARCQFCATRPVRTCSACGQQRTVAGTTDARPVCASSTRLRSGHAGTAAGPARSPGGRRHLPLTCATAAIKARRRSARSAGRPGPASGSLPAARSAAAAGPVLPGPASGAGAIVQSRRNGPPDRSAPAATSMSAATQPSAYGRRSVAMSWEGRSAARAPELQGWTTPAANADGEERSTAAGAVSAVSWLSVLTPCSPVPAGRFLRSCIRCSRHSPRSPTLPPW